MQQSEPEIAFRRAMGAFATGVAVVTAARAGGVTGITVNSFTSVSLTPPLVLWCLGEQSARYDLFAAAEHWGVTVLAAEEEGVARRLARAESEALAAYEVEEYSGAPVMRAGLAHLSCITVERRPAGDHLIIIGEVTAFRTASGDALGFYRGLYGRVRDVGMS